MNNRNKKILASSDYRNTLAKEIKSLRKSTFVENKEELIKNLLIKERATDKYGSEQEKIREAQKNLRFDIQSEKEIVSAKDGTLIHFAHKYIENVQSNKDIVGEIFLSLNKEEGFKLLKSIDNELKKNESLSIEIHLLDNFDNDGHPIKGTTLHIPFFGIPPNKKQNKYDLTVAEVMNPSEENKKKFFGEFNTYSGNSGYNYLRMDKKIKENRCELLEQWAKYIEDNYERAGFHYNHYTTYGSLYDMDHDDPTNDISKLRNLFDEFLNQKKINLVEDNHNLDWFDVKKIFMIKK